MLWNRINTFSTLRATRQTIFATNGILPRTASKLTRTEFTATARGILRTPRFRVYGYRRKLMLHIFIYEYDLV